MLTPHDYLKVGIIMTKITGQFFKKKKELIDVFIYIYSLNSFKEIIL